MEIYRIVRLFYFIFLKILSKNLISIATVEYRSIPPGFNGGPWQPQQEPENWMNLDPAIIFSAPNTSTREEQEQQRHLLGNELINDVFNNHLLHHRLHSFCKFFAMCFANCLQIV